MKGVEENKMYRGGAWDAIAESPFDGVCGARTLHRDWWRRRVGAGALWGINASRTISSVQSSSLRLVNTSTLSLTLLQQFKMEKWSVLASLLLVAAVLESTRAMALSQGQKERFVNDLDVSLKRCLGDVKFT
ncbi:hypothetical protein B566_EDAN007692 [Ephemera danica]|nr:hypothetical protein B566_EDAN007692 [Ephemera danica]